jgi:hypothetical protein
VIGKANFSGSSLIYTNGMPAPTASNLLSPGSLFFDPNGILIVADPTYNRVLMYLPPFSNGMAATVVLGQPNMTSNNADQCSGQGCTRPTPTANSLWFPSVGIEF